MSHISFVLSFFDEYYGPKVQDSYSSKLNESLRKKVEEFMNFEVEDMFIEGIIAEEEAKIININFSIPSDWARGRKQDLMLSVIVDKNYRSDIFHNLLKETSEKIKNIPNIYKLFNKGKSGKLNELEKSELENKLETVLGEGLEKVKEIEKKPNMGVFLVLGLYKVGKTSIINTIKDNVFNPKVRPTLTINILEVVLDKYMFKTIDVSGQKRLRDQWWSYTHHPDAIIFVVDGTAKVPLLKETKAEFEKILSRFDREDKGKINEITPVLICLNKIDLLDKPQEKEKEFFNLLGLDNLPIDYKLQLTSAVTGEGIEQGFKWIIEELLKFA